MKLEKFSQFNILHQQLQYLVHNDGLARRNEFCVLAQKDRAFLGAYIYWKTAAKLIFWLLRQYDIYHPSTMSGMPVQIYLKQRLKAREDVNDHRNEMQRTYAISILASCETSGETFNIQKSD